MLLWDRFLQRSDTLLQNMAKYKTNHGLAENEMQVYKYKFVHKCIVLHYIL